MYITHENAAAWLVRDAVEHVIDRHSLAWEKEDARVRGRVMELERDAAETKCRGRVSYWRDVFAPLPPATLSRLSSQMNLEQSLGALGALANSQPNLQGAQQSDWQSMALAGVVGLGSLFGRR